MRCMDLKDALKQSVLDLLTKKGSKTELQLGFRFSFYNLGFDLDLLIYLSDYALLLI